jgi:hypothetical protein
MKTAFLNHANAINNEAQALLTNLQLFPRWQAQGGEPVLVGALACGLALAPDIDMEVYFDAPTPAQGFEVLKACAGTPGLRAARFRDEMDGPDQGYYWRLDVLSEGGTLWKVDMWSVAHDHPGPTGREMVAPMRRALDDEKREAILRLKAALRDEPSLACPSIYLYQAVLASGVRDLVDLQVWLSGRDTTAINDWRAWL